MVAWSPDTTQAKQAPGGYWYPDPTITGFSLTHFSGRGVMYLMNVPFMPVIGPVNVSPGTDWEQFAAAYSHTNESASPGYYRVKLDNGIESELTATPRTGMARFTFPTQSPAALLIRAGTSVSVFSNSVTGFCIDNIGGGKRAFVIYFAMEFDRPFQTAKTWLGADIRNEANSSRRTPYDKDNSGAILTFDTTTNPVVQARVGISYVSPENARENLARENPGWDFAVIRKKADAQWNTVLNHIQVEGGTKDEKTTFYTSLYHCFIHPTLLDDVNGQYPGMDGKVHTVAAGHHQYQNIPAWDQYRSLEPLVAVLAPAESSDIMQSLVNYAQQDASVRPDGGGLPRWEQVNHNSGGMVGDGDDAIIASAYAFGARDFDTRGALVAMDKGASQPGTTSDGFEVRGGLDDYLKLGYVPKRVSVTLEYCNADFALSQFAEGLGDHQKSVSYQNRAQNWKNLYNDFTGLLRPKEADGSWAKTFSPTNRTGFTEGTAAQYVWMVNFNLGGLIDKLGGKEKAIIRLDKFFTAVNAGWYAETAYMGNEPCEETPWVYDFAAAPAHTQKVVRRIQQELFTTLPSGLPGNDDAGALSSWHVFSALGLYPEIPGVAGFVIGSPVFPKATIHLSNGAVIQIIGDHASVENCYVRKLELNGQSYDKLWLPWSAISKGAMLNFSLADKPSSWGVGPDSAPPSFDAANP
jgi:predicted alpha-1,2-mannosidase